MTARNLSLPYQEMCATGSSGPGNPHQRLTNRNHQRGQVCPGGAEISQSWDPLTCLWRQRKCLCCGQHSLPRRKGASPFWAPIWATSRATTRAKILGSHLGYIMGKNSPSSPGDLSLLHKADALHLQSFFMFSLIHWVYCILALPPVSPAALGNHSETQFPHL